MKQRELEQELVKVREELSYKTPSCIRNIDWEMLKKQKDFLISQDLACCPENFDGIISLINALQDYAVDIMGLSEEEVFNEE